MTNIKPIETKYKGYRFRSRLEARWAVFFDHCGIKYEYEHEGFELSSGEKYLPDFYLPEQDAFVEVKCIGAMHIFVDENDEVGFVDGRENSAKYYDFTFETVQKGHTVIIVMGDPKDALYSEDMKGEGHVFINETCWKCGKTHLSCYPFQGFAGNKILLMCGPDGEGLRGFPTNMDNFSCMAVKRDDNGKIKDIEFINMDSDDMSQWIVNTPGGAIAARQARFEHGEDGTNG